jgi:hypothetical protein
LKNITHILKVQFKHFIEQFPLPQVFIETKTPTFVSPSFRKEHFKYDSSNILTDKSPEKEEHTQIKEGKKIKEPKYKSELVSFQDELDVNRNFELDVSDPFIFSIQNMNSNIRNYETLLKRQTQLHDSFKIDSQIYNSFLIAFDQFNDLGPSNKNQSLGNSFKGQTENSESISSLKIRGQNASDSSSFE